MMQVYGHHLKEHAQRSPHYFYSEQSL